MRIKGYKYLMFSLLLSSITFANVAANAAQKVLNVSSFGAKGDGVTDDFKAIQQCFISAITYNDCIVYFPSGKYRISKTLSLHYDRNQIALVGEENAKSQPLIFSDQPISILMVKGYFQDMAQGTFKIKNISLAGAFPVFGSKNVFVNKPQWFVGLSVTDKSIVDIDRFQVTGIYGEGIYIATTKPTGGPINSRFKKVRITNSKVYDCWGYNPKSDDYGDGIYMANVASALIENNVIANDFNRTKQLGRCGIVLEYMAQNCSVSGNAIFGYDRGIHIEEDFGGHTISKNKITGTDLGIAIYSVSQAGFNNPIIITGNTISNYGLQKNTSLQRTRDIMAISDRALINFVAPNGSRAGSIVAGNELTVLGSFDYFSNAIINIRADFVSFKENTYRVSDQQQLKNRINYYNYSNSIPSNESFVGIQNVNFVKEKVKSSKGITANNKLNGGRVNIN